MIELFNIQDGENGLPIQEREERPNAEYFTAERKPYEYEKPEVKRVTLTFRRLIAVKDGKIVDSTTSINLDQIVAVKRDGKTVMLEDEPTVLTDEILGVFVRQVFHFDK